MADSRIDGSWGRRATNKRSTASTPSRPTSVSAHTRVVTAMVNLRVRAAGHACARSRCHLDLRRSPPPSDNDHLRAHGAGTSERGSVLTFTVVREYSPPWPDDHYP